MLIKSIAHAVKWQNISHWVPNCEYMPFPNMSFLNPNIHVATVYATAVEQSIITVY